MVLHLTHPLDRLPGEKCTLRCLEHNLQQKTSCCFLMCCSSSSNLEKTFGSEHRGHSGDSRCLIQNRKKNSIAEFRHLFIVHVFHSKLSLLSQVVYNSKEHGTVRKTKAGRFTLVPVLGVNFLVAEVDVMLLLTMKSMIGQTRERLYFFHKYHLKKTTRALYNTGSYQS